jgi:hypothetical protein
MMKPRGAPANDNPAPLTGEAVQVVVGFFRDVNTLSEVFLTTKSGRYRRVVSYDHRRGLFQPTARIGLQVGLSHAGNARNGPLGPRDTPASENPREIVHIWHFAVVKSARHREL